MVLDCVPRTAGSSIIWNYTDTLTSLELLNYYLALAIGDRLDGSDAGHILLSHREKSESENRAIESVYA